MSIDLRETESTDVTLSGDELDSMLEYTDLSTMEDISVPNGLEIENVASAFDLNDDLDDQTRLNNNFDGNSSKLYNLGGSNNVSTDMDANSSNDLSQISLGGIEDDTTDEEVKLSTDEMENILNGADVSEVELETSEEDGEPILSDLGEMEAVSSQSRGVDSLDTGNYQKLDEEENTLSKHPQKLQTLDDGADETVALSTGELDSILENVDETHVLDLEGEEESIVDDESEIVSLSDQEIDEFTNDELQKRDLNTFSFDQEGNYNVKESLEFEKEIMKEAQTSIDPPNDFTNSFSNEKHIDDSNDNIVSVSNKVDQKVAVVKVDHDFKAKVLPTSEGTIFKVEQGNSKNNLSSKPTTNLANKPSLKKIEDIPDPDLYELFSYLDKLLEDLPEDRIKEFAESKYYDKYISIINRLSI